MAEFVLYTGPMFSSKTTRLLSRIDRCKYQKKKVISLKPTCDKRYTVEDQIVTHNDLHLNCYTVETGDDVLDIVTSLQDDADAVAIDEIFMLPGAGSACIELFKKGYDVYVSSIELSFSGQPFDEVTKIMPYCTQIIKCSAVCAVCQKDARYTYKKIESHNEKNQKSEIHVGGKEIYEPRCQLHHKYMRC